MSPFEPRDGVAVWSILYDRLSAASINDVVTYTELSELIDADRAAVQSAVRRAAKELSSIDKRALVAVPNVGYRVIAPEEHLTLAKRHQAKSGRALKRGYSAAVDVDLSDVDPEVRKALGIVAQAFSMQMEFNRRTDVRQRKLEKQLDSMIPKVARNEAELAELRERMEKLERGN